MHSTRLGGQPDRVSVQMDLLICFILLLSLTVLFTCAPLMYRKIETFAFSDTQLVTITRVLQKNATCTSKERSQAASHARFAGITMITVNLISSLNISTNSDQTKRETIFESTVHVISK